MYIHIWKNKERGVILPHTNTLAYVPLKIRLKRKKARPIASGDIDSVEEQLMI